MSKIGIDAKVLCKKNAGIKTYLVNVIKYINSIDDDNEYYLYVNRDLDIDFPLSNKFHIRKYKSKVGTLGLITKVHKMIKKDQIDIFWGPEHVLPKKVKNVSYYLTIHDLTIFKIRGIGSLYNTIINKLFTKKSVKKADKVIAISKATKQDIVDLFHVSENKVEVIYNTKKLYAYHYVENRLINDDFKEVKEKFDINKDFFLFVGTIEPRKNIRSIIKAFNSFKEKDNDCKLIIAGGNGWKTKKIYKEYEKSPFRDDIVFTGYVSSKEKELLYRNSLSLLFPSLYEGFGYPIIESLSVGTPVITSNVSSMPEVGGNVCHYVNNPLDYNEICKQMIAILNSWKNKEVNELDLVKQSNIYNNDDYAQKTIELLTKEK